MKIRLTSFCLLILVIGACTSTKVKPVVSELRCEYLPNPVGMEVVKPRLSWQMKKGVRGAKQTAYRIMAASTDELLLRDNPDLWDSGKVNSDQSVQVEYKGKPLKSGMKVSWKVQIWDEEGNKSDWSTISHWEMGLLQITDWQAYWIGAPASLATKESKLPSPLFRKEMTISKKIRQARAYISGLGYYELYINGQKIGDHVLSPNQTNYDRQKLEKWKESRVGNMNSTVLYETFDITSYLRPGGNAFGVILGNGWYLQSDRPNDIVYWYDTPRMIAQFEIEYENGSKELIVSDESWESALSPIVYNGIHSGEIYDARLEQKGWNEAGFDDSKWVKAVCVRPPTGTLKAQISPPDRVTGTINPVSVTQPEKGRYRFDMGRLFSGWARLKISGAKGTPIKLRFIEEFGPTYGQTDTYILKGEGTEIWEPRFTWHAFRYVDVYGSPIELTIENLDGRVVNTDISRTGSFECSNQLLNKILDNYQWTLLGNVHGGVPSDCPHRERRGYTGDGQISAKAAIYNFDMSQFYTKWLNDISDAQNHQTGYVPNTTPYQDGGGGTAWGSAYVIIPWYMYQYYGDVRLLQQHYSGMKHWIEYMKNSLNKDGILANQGLGEWVPPDIVDLPADFVNSCYYYHCCHLMTEIAGVLENNSDKDYFTGLAEKAKTDINKIYFNAASSSYSIGRQGANVYPLGFGIADNQNVKAVFDNLVKNILGPNKAHFDTGILGTPLLLEVLTEMDRPDLAYTLMNQRDFPGFGYMIEKGATTIWETFQGDVSHSHPMFGSVCAWFYKSLGGITPDPVSPGFKHAIIKPTPVSSLTFANTSYQSMYGELKTQWKFAGDDYLLDVKIPANTIATVYVLANDETKVTESGNSITTNSHVKFLKKEGKYAVYQVESGDYQFVSEGSKHLLRNTILTNPIIHPADTLALVHDSIKITITSDVAEAHIHFTTDNSEPDSTSTLYTKPFPVSEPTVIKAKAILNGYDPSFTKTNFIDFINPKINGLTYKYYEGVWTRIPDFSKFPVIKSGTVYKFGLDQIIPTKDEYALTFEGVMQIKIDGTYEFYIQSNDGTRLFIDNKVVINHDGPHGADIEKTGKITLSKGNHPIQLHYFQAGGGMYLLVKYSGPGIDKQEVPAMVFFKNKLRMHKIQILILFGLISFNSFSQTYWKIENENGDEILLTLHLNDAKKTFEAYTRKDALKDLAGIFTYTLAKAAGKLKYPEIVFIEGKTQNIKDSLRLTGTFNYFDKQFLFSSSISGNHFIGKYIDNKNRPHQLTGIKVPNDKPIRDYGTIVTSAFSITEKNLLNPTWLKSGEWRSFRKKVNELKPKIADDYELAAIFYWLGKELPFSPYEIRRITSRNNSSERKNEGTLREVKGNAAVLDANKLPASQKEMDSIAVIIAKKGYTNIILDLRGRTNINPCTANVLVNYLSDKSFNAGIYLTRKWFESNISIPKVQDYKKLFKRFSDGDFHVGEIYKEQGRYFNIVQAKNAFKGKIYVLTDSKTSKVAEMLAYLLKNKKIAIIIGQKTAGTTVIAEHIAVNNEYELQLPVSDYYTSEGKSLIKTGIEPDIKVPGEDALKYVLKTL